MSKKLLITGGSGFVGNYLIEYFLKNSDYEIISLNKKNSLIETARLKNILNNFSQSDKKRLKLVNHNLRDEINVKSIKVPQNINLIIHLAAENNIDNSMLNPIDCIYDNVIGTLNILNFAKNADSIEKFIHFSSFEVFGAAPSNISFSEYDRYNSLNPFAASKAGAEELAVAFENCYSLPISIIHTMNIFGYRQDSKKFIPSTIKKIMNDQVVLIHSDANKSNPGSRKYIHASDLADGIKFIIDYDFSKIKKNLMETKCNKFNIVGLEEINNLQLAQHIASCIGKELNYKMVNFHENKPAHNLRFSLSSEKINALGWRPRSFYKTLKEVVNDYKANPDWLTS